MRHTLAGCRRHGRNAVNQRVTIADVARAAGVSPTTVSHALNGRGQVDARTRERVAQAAAALGYRPNRHAQRLRTGEAHMIVLLSSMPFAVAGGPSRLGFLMEIAAVAAAAALERGLAMVLAPPLETGHAPLDLLDVDGALVIEPSADDPNLDALRLRGLPVVSIGRQGGARDPAPFVDLHSRQATDLLLEHLWAQGARRIALVVGAAERNSYTQAQAAYDAMLSERGMPSLCLRMEETRGEEGGLAAAAELLARDPAIDAFCVPVDAFATGVARYLAQAGKRIPQDVMLATRYDGIRARMSEPPLTAVDLHLDEVAHLAIDLLFDHLRGDTMRRTVAGPAPQLVLRASSLRQS
ncbi:MAG: LacI family DNA-binding transcriptional regulator [Proteobacteria bacterium]|nr:LacI family DNA-binding transcriptional regulator [Pseudomonadota bacterium]